jgi:hypothetical protein
MGPEFGKMVVFKRNRQGLVEFLVNVGGMPSGDFVPLTEQRMTTASPGLR